jgi:hypothetical protein
VTVGQSESPCVQRVPHLKITKIGRYGPYVSNKRDKAKENSIEYMMEFTSTIFSQLRLGDASAFVTTVGSQSPIDCTFKVCLDINKTFADI